MPQPRRFLPGTTIGVMGGGQLGRMFAIAARRMGYRVHIFTPEADSPAAQFSDRATVAEYDNENAVAQFARDIDLLTFEFENIPARTIDWVARERVVRPRVGVLHTAQNRLREKSFLSDADFPLARFRRVTSAADLTTALEAVGRPAVLKGGAVCYDGKGQQRIDMGNEAAAIWAGRSDRE